MVASNVDWSHIYFEQSSYSRAVCKPEAMCAGGFRGAVQAWEAGQQWRGVLCEASPWVFTGGSDCLDWWFRMFTGSEGTIIHWGRGQQWIAFLPALLSLLMTPGPHPILWLTPYTSEAQSPIDHPDNLIITTLLIFPKLRSSGPF